MASINSTFVILLDADDKIGKDYLYEAERLMNSGCDVANPDAILFGERRSRWVVPDEVSDEMLLKRNYVHCCAAFRTSYWEQVGGIDETMVNWQDYDFWIRVAKMGARIKRLPGDHFHYRRHSGSKSSINSKRREELRRHIRSKYESLASC